MLSSSILCVLLGLISIAWTQGTQGGSQGTCNSVSDAWVSRGCYSDEDNGPHAGFTWQLSSDPNSVFYYPLYDGSLTIDICRQACRGHGFKYAGLYASSNCYCSVALPNPQAKSVSTGGIGPYLGAAPGVTTVKAACQISGSHCSGDANQFCGAVNATDIWEDSSFSGSPTAGSPNNFNYLGCFSNTPPRPLYIGLKTPTTADCASYCGQIGYSFMGRSGFDNDDTKSTCACGPEVQTGNQVDDRYCSFNCNGTTNGALVFPSLSPCAFSRLSPCCVDSNVDSTLINEHIL